MQQRRSSRLMKLSGLLTAEVRGSGRTEYMADGTPACRRRQDWARIALWAITAQRSGTANATVYAWRPRV